MKALQGDPKCYLCDRPVYLRPKAGYAGAISLSYAAKEPVVCPDCREEHLGGAFPEEKTDPGVGGGLFV